MVSGLVFSSEVKEVNEGSDIAGDVTGGVKSDW